MVLRRSPAWLGSSVVVWLQARRLRRATLSYGWGRARGSRWRQQLLVDVVGRELALDAGETPTEHF